jgi:hypothetical protein
MTATRRRRPLAVLALTVLVPVTAACGEDDPAPAAAPEAARLPQGGEPVGREELVSVDRVPEGAGTGPLGRP